MSTPAKEGPAVPPEKGKRLSSLVTRMKTVLKRSDGSKRLSFSSKPAAAPSSTAGPSTAKAEEPTAPTDPEPAKPEIPVPADGTKPVKVNRAELDTERARKLGERFKVTIEPVKRSVEKEAYRIEKPIRMRIHRQCHRCHTTFGSSKTCTGCEHTRCTKCPRYPPKKTEKKGKEPAVPGTGAIEADNYWGLRDVIELRKPNPRTGGQPLVRKKPMQRVRRTCHECSTMFTASAKICANCNHVRCADCPRDPAKKKKYPDGYPGDAPSSNTALPVKYSCHQCSKVFPPVPHPDSGTPQPKQDCVRCNHERCRDCPRAPPVRVEPEPDEELVRRVEEKLRGLNVGVVGGSGT